MLTKRASNVQNPVSNQRRSQVAVIRIISLELWSNEKLAKCSAKWHSLQTMQKNQYKKKERRQHSRAIVAFAATGCPVRHCTTDRRASFNWWMIARGYLIKRKGGQYFCYTNLKTIDKNYWGLILLAIRQLKLAANPVAWINKPSFFSSCRMQKGK